MRLGHSSEEAEDGAAAIENMKAESSFDLIVLDVNMPKMNGLEVLEKRKELGLQEKAIVFMLTTDSSPEFKEKAKELSVKAWITKPYHKESLLKVIKKVCD